MSRHDVVLTEPDRRSPLSVGNGDFACTVDISGMQTFTSFHDPLSSFEDPITNSATQSSWGWHEMPGGDDYSLDDVVTEYQTMRGGVEYADRLDMRGIFGLDEPTDQMAGKWLFANPQRLDLGRTGLLLRPRTDAEPETDPAVLSEIHQRLDLWTGTIVSSFQYLGERVTVTTAAHPSRSEVAFRIESSLLETGQIAVRLAFPYASDGFMTTSDWAAGDRHTTSVENGEGSARILRTLDATKYTVQLGWNDATIAVTDDPHVVVVTSTTDVLELVVSYSPDDLDLDASTSVGEVFAASVAQWTDHWSSGGAIDFSRCTDPRAHELERRVVLSQYLAAVHCSGHLPPQETGLLANSWQGKFHLEMHWWHAAHFVSWGRPELLERSLAWYRSILPSARDWAQRQGYEGVCWPKQVGPDGRDSPNEVGPFLVWQQPHLLYFAELLYRSRATATGCEALVDDLAEMLDATAEFMASFVDERDGEFHLLAPLVPAQESYDRHTTEDPTYELAYWWWGLEIAQRWRERRGLDRHDRWADVQRRLARPHQMDGVYTAIATEPYLIREDHPSLLAAYGVVPPTPLIDPDVMRATFADTIANWDWESAWGWDPPVVAMTAARLGDATAAVEALLLEQPRNVYEPTGHNRQRGNRIPVYLPANGALLSAISLMAGGWDGADRAAPGFPDDGTWNVEVEGFTPWP